MTFFFVAIDDVEILFNAEVASCASCRLVVLLSERLKEIRHRWIELHDSWLDHLKSRSILRE